MERRKVGYDLGCYGSMSEVWQAWPGGGRPGEYLRVGTVVYHWDAAQGNWRSDVYPHVESYRLARLDGDLSVGNRLMVGGSLRVMQDALFKRDVRIEGTLVYSHLRGMDCGLHPTYENLVAAFPTPKKGNWALVGTSADALSMYTCQSDGVWTMTAQHQNLSDVFSLSAYDNAVSVLDTIVSKGYIFQGVAFPGTVPACPSSHKAFYLASTRGRYDHFGGIEVRGLTAILWEPIASPDDIQVPAVPVLSSNSNEEVAVVQQNVGSEEAVTTGAWHAYLLLAGVFVYGENIANDSIGMNHLTPELRNYINQLALDITNVRQDMNNGLNNLEKKLRGVGTPANAFLYPTFRLGDFSTMDEVNTAIDEVFGDVNETKHQGHLRLTRNGQMIFIDQYAIDYSVGKWAQVAIGMVAPSADGLQLVQASDHPHILWRMAGVDDDKWHDISGTMSLKTINGQSLFGQGNITIGEAAQIVIDRALDESSNNAIANSTVAVAIRQLVEAVQQVMADRAVIAVDYWCSDEELPFTPLHEPVNGEVWWDTANKVLYRYSHGVWNTLELSEDAIYLRKSDRSLWTWDSDDMEPIGGSNTSFNAIHRCYADVQRSVVVGRYYIDWDGSAQKLYIGTENGKVETNADPNALYYYVPNKIFYVAVEGEPSPYLELYHDKITPIFEIINYDENNTCSEDMSLPYGYYVYKKTEGQLLQQLYEHSTGSWTVLYVPKAYLIYNNEVLLYENNVVTGTGIKFKESFIRVSRWAQAIATGTAYGQYGYSTMSHKLYRWDGNQWYEVSLSTSMLYLDTVHNKLYRWNGSDMVEVGGGGSTTQVQADWSQTNQNAPDFIKNKDRVENRLNELEVAEIARADEDTSDEKLYPEYWLDGEPIYAKNYYNWNTVRYNSAISNPGASDPSVVQDDLPSGTTAVVLHPSEHLNGALTYTQSLKDTTSTAKKMLTEDVYYDQDNHIFLLKIGNTYYKHWTNSYLWQNDGALREDTVYSSIAPGASVTSTMKAIIQWKVENGVIVPLTEGDALSCCTDFSTAFAACLAANNGNMRLRNNRIYGLCKAIGDISHDNFVIDGQGATICYIPRRRKEPQGSGTVTENSAFPLGNVLKFVSSHSFVVKNLKIKGVRTAVRNVASGVPFCFSNTDAFGIRIFDCSDVRIENVEMTGMGYDFGIDGTDSNGVYHITDKVVIKDWKSKASEGLFMKLVSNLVLDGADVEQGKYSSKHLIYCNDSRFAKNHVIRNSRLIQNSIYNPNIIQYKTSQSTPSTDPATGLLRVGNLSLYNCFLQVSCGILNNTPTNTFNLMLDHCTLMQHSQQYGGSIGYWASGSVYRLNQQSRAIISTNCWSNLTVKDCQFITWGAAIYLHNQEHNSLADSPSVEDPKIRIEDSSFVVLDPANYSNYASSLFATQSGNRLIYLEVSNMGGHDYSFETHNVRSNIDHLLQADRLNKADAIEEIGKRAELQASASAASFGTGLPVGYCYFNTVAGKPLWIASIAQDNTYNWVDAMGNPYTTNGGQVTP